MNVTSRKTEKNENSGICKTQNNSSSENEKTIEVFKDIIVDMDGTIADIKARVIRAEANPPQGKRMDWNVFLDPIVMAHSDQPNEHVVHLVRMLQETGHRIIVTSARNERHREITTLQLETWGIKYERLYLRKDDDFRQDGIVKAELYEQILSDGYMPRIAIDDRNQVVEVWREKLGIHCWQVEETKV